MLPVLYQLSGTLGNGQYLPGHYWWTSTVVVTRIQVMGNRPTAGTLTLQLEVDGTLTSYSIAIAAGTGPFVVEDSLVASVISNEEVRWRASYDGLPEQAASAVCLLMTVAPLGAVALPDLTVRDGGSGLIYYCYNPTTGLFISTVAASVSPAWTLTQEGQTSLAISFSGTEVFSVRNGVVAVETFYAMGGVATGVVPRAEFWVGDTKVATLTGTGELWVVSLCEGAPSLGSALALAYYSQFAFYSNNTLTAILNASGLTALALDESLTA